MDARLLNNAGPERAFERGEQVAVMLIPLLERSSGARSMSIWRNWIEGGRRVYREKYCYLDCAIAWPGFLAAPLATASEMQRVTRLGGISSQELVQKPVEMKMKDHKGSAG